MFLKMIFHGYVNWYSCHRWNKINSYTDMTQKELTFFSDLGTKLGFIAIREQSERPTPTTLSNPRDLVWIDTEANNKIFLHLERENESQGALNCFFTDNKIKESVQYGDERYILGVFGFLKENDYIKIKNEIKTNNIYRDRNILIIGFCGKNKDTATDCVGLVFSQNICYERWAKAETDKAGFWYLFFEPTEQNNQWCIV